MTKERRERLNRIADAMYDLRCELESIRLDESGELPTIIDDMRRRQSSREHIKEIGKATDLFAEGLSELGY